MLGDRETTPLGGRPCMAAFPGARPQRGLRWARRSACNPVGYRGPLGALPPRAARTEAHRATPPLLLAVLLPASYHLTSFRPPDSSVPANPSPADASGKGSTDGGAQLQSWYSGVLRERPSLTPHSPGSCLKPGAQRSARPWPH